MQLKDEPKGFIQAAQKHKITGALLAAISALSEARSRLDLIDHEPGCSMMADYQANIKRLIVEISQLQPPAEASPAPAGCSSEFESQSFPVPCSARQ